MSKSYIGIDIGGTAVKVGKVNEDGQIQSKKNYSVNFDDYKTPILDTVIQSMKLFLKQNQISESEITGIGVSATGAIDSVHGIVAGSAGHLLNWDGSRIKEQLERMFNLPVSVLNDANAAALGEMWLGAARHKKNVIVITIGTGVGGGIIVNSQILLGANGFAGEIGHIAINNDGEKCSCGNIGCLEHYGSTTALVNRVLRAKESSILELPDGTIDGCFIFEEVKNGNTEMERILDEWINDISSGIVSLVHIFNPEIVLVGGGVSAQKELFIDKLRKKVKRKCMPHFAKELKLEAAELGNDAGLVGAVYYCMQKEKDKMYL